MARKDDSPKASRRKCMKIGAGIAGGGIIGTAAATRYDHSTAMIVSDNGVLVSKTKSSSLSWDNIQEARDRAFSYTTEGTNDVVLATVGEQTESQSLDNKVAYYIGWNGQGRLEERFWSAPSSADHVQRKVIEKRAKVKVENGSVNQGLTFSDDHWGDDPVGADPAWEYETTVTNDDYIEANLGGETYTLGRVDLQGQLYEAPSPYEDKRQWGFSLAYLQWPGDYLDEYDSAVSQGTGLNRKGKVEQYWKYNSSSTDTELVDLGPSSEKSWGCKNLEGISIGANSSGPYGEVTVNPSSKGVNDVVNMSDPDVDVTTVYKYGGPFGHDSCGGDVVVRAGNSGVFFSDADSNLIRARIYGTFQGRENGDIEEKTGHTGFAVQPD